MFAKLRDLMLSRFASVSPAFLKVSECLFQIAIYSLSPFIVLRFFIVDICPLLKNSLDHDLLWFESELSRRDNRPGFFGCDSSVMDDNLNLVS